MSLFCPPDERAFRGKTSDSEDMVNVRFVELAPPCGIVGVLAGSAASTRAIYIERQVCPASGSRAVITMAPLGGNRR